MGPPITPRAGRTCRWTSPASASASSAPERPRSRRSRRSPRQAKQLTVFQRRPNWAAPLHNAKISKEEMEQIKSRYEEIYAYCATTPMWFIHQADSRKTLDVPPEEREAFWEKLYAEPGFGIWLGNFRDIGVNEKANAAISEFIARKIRQRVKDPKVAEKLIPKDHGFATRRVPLESGYFEAYNRDNVTLVDTLERRADRVHHSEGHQDHQAGLRIRHPDLRHRLRWRDRRVRSHRYPRHERPAAEGCLGRKPAHLSRHAGGRFSEYADGAGSAHRSRQYSAGHRTQRAISDRHAAVHAGTQLHPCGNTAASRWTIGRRR